MKFLLWIHSYFWFKNPLSPKSFEKVSVQCWPFLCCFAGLLGAVSIRTLSQRRASWPSVGDRFTQVWMVNVRLVQEVIVTKGTNMASLVECPLGQIWAHLISISKMELFCKMPLYPFFSQAQWDYWCTWVWDACAICILAFAANCNSSFLLQCSNHLFLSIFSTSLKQFLSSLESGSFHSCHLCFRIKIEEEYAKNLSKLSLSPLAAQEEGWVQ